MISLASASVNVGEDNEAVSGVNIFSEAPLVINYVNESNISEYWNTAEGLLNNVADISGSWLTNDLGWLGASEVE